MPARTSVSSSATSTRITPAAAGRVARTLKAGARARLQVERAADLLQPPPHPLQSAGPGRAAHAPRAVVARRQLDRAARGAGSRSTGSSASACLTALVTISWQQRRSAWARSGSASASSAGLHVDARPRDPGRQRGQRARPRSSPRSSSQRVHHRLHVVQQPAGQRSARSPAARRRRRRSALRAGSQVEAERGQVMPHGVVQLARDAQPLAQPRALRQQLARGDQLGVGAASSARARVSRPSTSTTQEGEDLEAQVGRGEQQAGRSDQWCWMPQTCASVCTTIQARPAARGGSASPSCIATRTSSVPSRPRYWPAP